ncbi:S8 family peptidase [Crocosphaera sp. XPORK-15E]|uniref:S8 family peptidase n=1 Tax=Crocosphaera sp. XPORK-15E TaxID=3110247 RepID=UPI002B1ECC38|nr:S8 family serine peptidase [Crocosphaera sp. XPORK-15E]MEA5534821.1 S8 family serine peptidase [Crocosphaera sp. XPORK-15E]
MTLSNVFLDSQGKPIDGAGFSVVIIDTGIDLNHSFFGPDLYNNTTKNGSPDGIADRIVYQYDFAGNTLGGPNDSDASDKNNHGSHVASIAASSNATYPGVASGANIIALKVFPDSGGGGYYDIQEALQWVVANAETYNIASVNMSLADGSNFTTAVTPSLYDINKGFFKISDELQALANKNVIVVSAAGNNGQNGVSYPAADPNSLAVSSVDQNGNIASTSQYSTTLTDVFARGVSITAANKNGGTTTLSGTSMAAPVVTGAIAVAQQLAEQELGRRLTLAEIRYLLTQGDDVTNQPDYEGKLLNITKLGEAILEMAPYDPTTHLSVMVDNSPQPSRLLSYGGSTQDKDSNFTISDNSNVLTLTGNTWKKVSIDYNITPNTILEFKFESTKQGEIHAIGFDKDNITNSNTHFKLFGTENWQGDIENFNTYTGGLKTYKIEVGKYFTGQYDYLTFVNDNDANIPNVLSRFSDLKLYEFDPTLEPVADPSKLKVRIGGTTQQFDLESYGGSTQDVSSQVDFTEDGNRVKIVGNSWKKINIGNYNITQNTVLEFDFESTKQGEIQGIGFDNNNNIDPVDTQHLFQVYGTQSWGINTNNYTGGIKHYQINLGNYLTGNYQYLTFANDHDVKNPNAESIFNNIKLYELPPTSPSLPASKLNIKKGNTTESLQIESYGGDKQDLNPTVTLSDDGNQLQVVGNGWKKIDLINYNITVNTVLEFDFESTKQGEIQGIGFDNDNNIDTVAPQHLFQVYGTQSWGINTNNYTGGIKHYTINAGEFFTGSFKYLTFANDHDVNNPNAVSRFNNIKLYEKTVGTAQLTEKSLLGTGTHQVGLNAQEIDTLTATEQADIFSLGTSTSPLYNQNGSDDYALIKGFNVTQDTINLHGQESDYLLSSSSGSLPKGTAIFLKTDQGNELIGIVENVDGLTVENHHSNFNFIS